MYVEAAAAQRQCGKVGKYLVLSGVGKGPCVPPVIRADQGAALGLPWTQKRRITRHSYTPHKSPGRHGGANKGWPTNNVCLGDLRVSLCAPLIRADQGPLCGSSGLENKGKQGQCMEVRFLGGSR